MKYNPARHNATLRARRTARAIPAICIGWALALPGTLLAQAHGVATAARCEHPAPIENTFNPATPSVTLTIRHDVDLQSVAARLIRAYSVQLHGQHIIHSLVVAPITAELVERLRCEPDIELVSYAVPVYGN
jgi:hypothetical protein